MKKLTLLILVVAALFASCNNLTVEKNKDSKSGNVTINIANQSRTISPMSGVSLDKFEDWTITFIDQNDFIDEKSLTRKKDNLTFTVPAGIYTVTVESSYTPPVTSDGGSVAPLTLTGTKTDVEIGENTKVNISVGLAKESTGDFKYTLTGYVSGFVSLVDMKTGVLSYSAKIQEEEPSDEPPLKAVYNYNGEIPELVVTGTGLKSGFYKLYVTDTDITEAENTDAVIYYDIGDFLVEIADGLETTGYASSVSTSQTQLVYYGTNDKEATVYNGKFPFARKNVNEILKLLIDNKKWQFVDIYMEDVPVLDVVVINQLKAAMTAGDRSESAEGYYYVRINNPAGDTLIDLSATEDKKSGAWKSEFSVNQVTELSLNADSADEYPEVSKELVIDYFETRDVFVTNLILEDGVTIVTSSTNGISPKEQLTVELDDYNTYEKTPFLVYSDVESIPEMSIVFANEAEGEDTGYVAAQKTESTTDELTEEVRYTISWYARVACPSGAFANEAIPGFTIKTSAGTETAGVTTIPVAAGSTIEFSTSIGNPDAYAFAWYFTNRQYTVLDIDSVYEFDPTTAEEFDFIDGEPITIACVVSDGEGNWGSAVFQFVLTAAQSPVILYNNKTDDTLGILESEFTEGLAAFDIDKIEASQTIGTFLHDGAIRDFCFDGNCNLYVVSVNEKESTSTIYKYAYSLFSGYSSESQTVATAAVDDAGGWQVVSCDTENGYLFTASGAQITVFVPGDQEYAEYPLDVSESVDEIKLALFSQTEGVNCQIKNIAASNGALYIAMNVTQTVTGATGTTAPIIARYTYEETGNPDEPYEAALNYYKEISASEVFSDTSSVAVTVNDMMVQDSKLYVLVSQQAGRSSSSVTHRGALLTITDNNGSLTLTSYGANDNNYAKKALDKDEKTFYAPQKFLAVMPKKLVIADEGFWIDESNNYGVVNRVVTVDLAEDVKDYSSEAVNVNVSFDLNISISACGSLYVDVK